MPPPQQPNAAGAVVLVGVVSAMVLFGGIAAAVFVAAGSSHATGPKPPIVVSPPMIPTAAKPKPLPLSALHTATIGWMMDISVDAPGRVGSLDHFDPLANWEWAHSIGTAWWSDAKLYQLTANPIASDGTVDLTLPEVRSIPPSAEYHFVSQDCKASEKKRAETTTGFEAGSCSLEVRVTAGAIFVRMDLSSVEEGGGGKPIPKPACSIAQVFSHLADTHKLTTRPTYDIRLDNDVFGFNYTVGEGLGSSPMDPVDVSPNFCVKAGAKPVATGAATPATTSASTNATPTITAKATPHPPFDRGAAASALKASGAGSCRTGSDSFHATVTFQPDGSVSSATVTDPNVSPSVSQCASQKLRAVHVPAFDGSPVSVGMSFQ